MRKDDGDCAKSAVTLPSATTSAMLRMDLLSARVYPSRHSFEPRCQVVAIQRREIADSGRITAYSESGSTPCSGCGPAKFRKAQDSPLPGCCRRNGLVRFVRQNG